ncbi:MAG: conjugal transfer protein, partial [Oscillospiraceae bacterium]|nr:conjugal transfer protein [Oscillospiraceae bacterium]
MDYTKLRAEERSEWSAYGQQQGKLKDMKAVSSAIVYLKHYNIVTLDELEKVLDEKNAKATEIRKSMRSKESRMKTIASVEKAVSVVMRYKSVHDEYIKIGWKGKQKRFAENYSTELAAYNKADRYLRKQGIDASIDSKPLKAEYRRLETEVSEQQKELEIVKKDLQPLKDVRFWVNKVIASKEQPAENKPEPKHSLIEKLKYMADVEKSDSTERNQQKKQDIDR